MEAERLRSVLSAVVTDANRFNIPNRLAQVETTYAQSLAQPTAATAQAFENALVTLRELAPDSECSRLSPSKQRILEAIGGADFFGEGLATRVQAILEHNRTMPASTVPVLQRLRSEAETFIGAAQSIVSGFDTLNIKEDSPPEDECEVGIVLPMELVDRSLEGFEKELRRFDRVLRIFEELVDGQPSSPVIRSIGSSSLEVFVLFSPIGAAALVKALDGIVLLYKHILEVRVLQRDLSDKSAPGAVLDGIRAWERELVEDGLKKLREEMLEEYGRRQPKRTPQEFSIALYDALKTLADRIDRGADVEVSAPEPSAEESITEEPSDETEPKERQPENLRRALAEVHEKGAIVRSLDRQSEPVLGIDAGEDVKGGRGEGKRGSGKSRPSKSDGSKE